MVVDGKSRHAISSSVTVGHVPLDARIALATVVYLISTGRWGSYVHVGPFYITDLALAACLAALVCRYVLSRGAIAIAIVPLVPIGLFLYWLALRLVTTPPLDQSGLRDAAPYVYAAVAVVAFLSDPTPLVRLSARWLRRALVLHAGLAAIAVLVPSAVASLPTVGNGIHILELRSDFDGALLGCLVALCFLEWARGIRFRRVGWQIGLAVLAMSGVSSRAGLLGSLIAAGAAFMSWTTPKSRARQMLWGTAVVVVTITALLLVVAPPESGPLARFADWIGVAPKSVGGADPSGTTRARSEAWRLVFNYVTADGVRSVAGVGFEGDYMGKSGARAVIVSHLVTDADLRLRAPHSFLVNTFAVLGLVGTALFMIVIIAWVSSWRYLRNFLRRSDPAIAVIEILPVGLLVAALLGVILESPFGAVPFWFTLGLSMSWAASRGWCRDSRRPARDLSTSVVA